MTQMTRRIRYTEYVEVISKETGGRVFECPHCTATFDSFDEAAQLALIQCVAHARACSKKAVEVAKTIPTSREASGR